MKKRKRAQEEALFFDIKKVRKDEMRRLNIKKIGQMQYMMVFNEKTLI